MARKQGQFLVPPPPANMPSMLASSVTDSPFLKSPQADTSASDAPSLTTIGDVPSLSLPSASMTANSPEFLNLKDRAMKSQSLADDLQKQLTGWQDQSDLTIPQSNFEKSMQNAVESKMSKLLTADSTPGDRFERGWDLGQKLTANILVPAFGSLTKSAGGAMGVADSIDSLKQQSLEADRTRLANKQSRNALLAQLASLYENISPTSAKNLLELTKLKLDLANKNMANKNALQGHTLQALHTANEDQASYFNALKGLDESSRKAAIDQFNADLARHRELREGGATAFNQKAKTEELQNEKTRIGQAEKAQNLAERKFGFEQENEGKKFSLAKSTQEFAAGKELLGRVAGLSKDLSTPGTLGIGRKYDGLLGRLQSNPLFQEETDQLIKRAGLGGKLTARGMLDQLAAQQEAQKPQSNNWNPFDAAAGAVKSVFNSKQTAPDPKAAADAFYLEHGRPPSAKELAGLVNGG